MGRESVTTDRDFLIWIHERLGNVYGDHPGDEHMHKLRAIIAATPESRTTLNRDTHSSIAELLAELKGGMLA